MSVASPTVVPRGPIFPTLLPKPPQPPPLPLPRFGQQRMRMNAIRDLVREMDDLSDEEDELDDLVGDSVSEEFIVADVASTFSLRKLGTAGSPSLCPLAGCSRRTRRRTMCVENYIYRFNLRTDSVLICRRTKTATRMTTTTTGTTTEILMRRRKAAKSRKTRKKTRMKMKSRTLMLRWKIWTRTWGTLQRRRHRRMIWTQRTLLLSLDTEGVIVVVSSLAAIHLCRVIQYDL